VNPLFNINFRREAYVQQMALARRRVIALAIWVAYFGVLTILIGLYGLNCMALARRTGLIERQANRLKASGAAHAGAQLRSTELAQIERYVTSSRRWRDRLARLSAILPANSRINSLAVNPQNLSDVSARNQLVITGSIRSPGPEDRMQNVMKIVSSLRSDTLFATGYRTIKLSSTRITEDGAAEFVIECR